MLAWFGSFWSSSIPVPPPLPSSPIRVSPIGDTIQHQIEMARRSLRPVLPGVSFSSEEEIRAVRSRLRSPPVSTPRPIELPPLFRDLQQFFAQQAERRAAESSSFSEDDSSAISDSSFESDDQEDGTKESGSEEL